MDVDDLYGLTRIGILVSSSVGIGLAAGELLATHLDLHALARSGRNGVGRYFALSRRVAALLNFAVNLALYTFAWTAMLTPTPNVPYDGAARVFLVFLVSLLLVVRSLVTLVVSGRVQHSIETARPGGRRTTDPR